MSTYRNLNLSRVCRSHPFADIGTLSAISTVNVFAPLSEQSPAPGYETFAFGLTDRANLLSAWIDHYVSLGIDTTVVELNCQFPKNQSPIDLTKQDSLFGLSYKGIKNLQSEFFGKHLNPTEEFDLADHLWALPSIMRLHSCPAAIHWVKVPAYDGQQYKYKAITLDTSAFQPLSISQFTNHTVISKHPCDD